MIIDKLRKFSNDILELGDPITDNRLLDFEKENKFILPTDFKTILTTHNGFSLMGTGVNGIGEEFRSASLDKMYYFEHYEVGNSMPKEYVPFSPDGAGNHYCLNLSRIVNEICPVIFWKHDIDYEDISEVETCNTSFSEWIEEFMIESVLEDYNYDGTEK